MPSIRRQSIPERLTGFAIACLPADSNTGSISKSHQEQSSAVFHGVFPSPHCRASPCRAVSAPAFNPKSKWAPPLLCIEPRAARETSHARPEQQRRRPMVSFIAFAEITGAILAAFALGGGTGVGGVERFDPAHAGAAQSAGRQSRSVEPKVREGNREQARSPPRRIRAAGPNG